jgi:hypothetical protein
MELLVERLTRQDRLIALLQRLSVAESAALQATQQRVLALERALIERGFVAPDVLDGIRREIAAQVEVDAALEPIQNALTRDIEEYLRRYQAEGEDPGKSA